MNTVDEMLNLCTLIWDGLQTLSLLDIDGDECIAATRALVEANIQVWTLVAAHKVGEDS